MNVLEINDDTGNQAENGYYGDGLHTRKEDKSGTLSPPRQLLWGADGLLGTHWREASGDERASYFLWDTQGNLALSYSETGQLSRSFGFTAYGSPLPDAGGELAQATFGYGGKFGYLRDGETGPVLCTWRFYDPSLGTWTQRDPIGYAGGQNLYGYVDGDPANLTDPEGLIPAHAMPDSSQPDAGYSNSRYNQVSGLAMNFILGPGISGNSPVHIFGPNSNFYRNFVTGNPDVNAVKAAAYAAMKKGGNQGLMNFTAPASRAFGDVLKFPFITGGMSQNPIAMIGSWQGDWLVRKRYKCKGREWALVRFHIWNVTGLTSGTRIPLNRMTGGRMSDFILKEGHAGAGMFADQVQHVFWTERVLIR